MHDLPERVEFAYGEIGPYSDEGKRTLLANWGADEVIRLTGPEIWREALAALGERIVAVGCVRAEPVTHRFVPLHKGCVTLR